MANAGKEYELFVANLQQALLNAENVTTQKSINIEVDKKILDNCGIERQFDIYWEYESGGLMDVVWRRGNCFVSCFVFRVSWPAPVKKAFLNDCFCPNVDRSVNDPKPTLKTWF